MQFFFEAIILFGNLWVWRIFNLNFFTFISVILTSSLFLYEKKFGSFRSKAFLAVLMIILCVIQIRTSTAVSLTNMTNEDIRIRDMRLKEYPPVYISVKGKTLWIPAAHWFEERRETIASFRILNNFSQVVDPNLYFFANHPRERIEVSEFEKFPYILLPFCILGIFVAMKKRKYFLFMIGIIIPILLLSIIGIDNLAGPFLLLPFLTYSIFLGVASSHRKLKLRYPNKANMLSVGILALYFLVFIQIASYQFR